MILTETIFYRDQAIGRLLEDTNAGRVRFQPIEGHNSLVTRSWVSAKACRKAVIRACKKVSK